MENPRLRLVPLVLVSWVALFVAKCAAETGHAHTFELGRNSFLLDGKPLLIVAGEMHPTRIPPEYWRDRLKKARAMGLNTIPIYMFWNAIEPKPGEFNFSGFTDVARFVRMAQEEGLYVVLRPGPYSCAEWDFGGFPSWLLKDRTVKVRTRDERFLQPAARYMKRLGQELAPLQITRGGPILMVQIENEYGSFSDDKVYVGRIRDMIRDAGFDVPLCTDDNVAGMPKGRLPDVWSSINVPASMLPATAQDVDKAVFDPIRRFWPNGPFYVAEFYPGRHDQWGEPHNTVSGDLRAQQLDWLLARGVSVSFYMFHGGTNFGFTSGGCVAARYVARTTSYDYDAPLDEAGRPAPKFFKFRDVIAKHLPQGTTIPDLPPPNPVIEIPSIRLDRSVALRKTLGEPLRSEHPLSMEDVGQTYGFILYRTKLAAPTKGPLAIHGLRDYAAVFVDGVRVAELDRRLDQESVEIAVVKPGAVLEILVENCGRIDSTPHMVDNCKGITGKVILAGKELTGWEMFPLPMEDPRGLDYDTHDAAGPAFYRGQFTVDRVGDTFLDMRGWGKGFVWINGHNLGRFWYVGPQQTLYLPGPWLKQGPNEIVIFEMREHQQRTVRGLKEPILDQLVPATPTTTSTQSLDAR